MVRGFQDAGITGGAGPSPAQLRLGLIFPSGPYSLDNLLRYIDKVHSAGAGIYALQNGGGLESSHANWEYEAACWLLASNGRDWFDITDAGFADWQPTIGGINLGTALGPRYRWQGLLRRDFTLGVVLVNEPGAPGVAPPLPSTRALQGIWKDAVTTLWLPAGPSARLLWYSPTAKRSVSQDAAPGEGLLAPRTPSSLPPPPLSALPSHLPLELPAARRAQRDDGGDGARQLHLRRGRERARAPAPAPPC